MQAHDLLQQSRDALVRTWAKESDPVNNCLCSYCENTRLVMRIDEHLSKMYPEQ